MQGIISSEAELAAVVDAVERETEIAVDLEMDSLHHYREKVCLIQISTRKQSWLIDPLAIADLSCLAIPFSNPDLLVVMHGADYDIRSLHRDFGIEVCNLFDTMVASRLLGINEFGLAALLKARFGIELDKKYQKADWSRRPLSPEMCAYAIADTATLLPLYDQLASELQQAGRRLWLDEECRLISQARVTEKNGPLFLGFKGAGKFKGRGLAVLESLLQMRDRLAMAQDRPPFKILSAECLQELADKRPRSLNELTSIKGMTPGQIQRYGDKIITAVAEGLAVPEAELPRFPRISRDEISEGARQRTKQLKAWRQDISARFGLDSGVVAPNWLLEAVAEQNPASMEGLGVIAGMRNWQRELYGQEIVTELVRG